MLRCYATPYITGLFLVSLISGIAFFFHVGPGALHPMHEWLSMVLILPFVLHLWRNVKPLKSYFSGKPMAIALAAALAFFVPMGGTGTGTGGRGGNPAQAALANRVLAATPASVAPVLGTTADALVVRLQAAGYTVTDGKATLSDIATASGKTTADLASFLVQPAAKTAP